jgi:hypothetical protein
MIPRAAGEPSTPREASASISVRLFEFLEEWLPARFRELCAANPNAGQVVSSLHLQLGADAWWIGAGSRSLTVRATDGNSPALLRLDAKPEAFLLLVVEAGSDASRNPALRMLQINERLVSEVQSVSGAVRLLVTSGTDEYELVVSAGSLPAEVICTLRCELVDLRRVQAGAVEPLDLFIGGKLRVEGDFQAALTLGSLFL